MIKKKNILVIALAASMVLPSNLASLSSLVDPVTVFANTDEEEDANDPENDNEDNNKEKIDLSQATVALTHPTYMYVLSKGDDGKATLKDTPTFTVTVKDEEDNDTPIDSSLYTFELDSNLTVGADGGSGKIVSSGQSVTKKNGKTQVAIGDKVVKFPVYGTMGDKDSVEITWPTVDLQTDTPSSIASKVKVKYINQSVDNTAYKISYRNSKGLVSDDQPFQAGTYIAMIGAENNSFYTGYRYIDLKIDENGKITEITTTIPSGNTGNTGGGSSSSKPKPKPKPEPKPEEPIPMTPVVGTPTSMYRLYNRLTGEHFFTTNKDEYNSLLNSDTWQNENQGWIAPTVSNFPVYRLLNPNTTGHHYTTDQNEYDVLQSLGWVGEGPAFYSADKDNPENVQLHRLYNPNEKEAGSHHYTADEKERDALVAMGWTYEGLAWAGLPAE